MAGQGSQDMNEAEAVEAWRSVVAHQHLPYGLRQQVHLYCLLCHQEGPRCLAVPGQTVPA